MAHKRVDAQEVQCRRSLVEALTPEMVCSIEDNVKVRWQQFREQQQALSQRAEAAASRKALAAIGTAHQPRVAALGSATVHCASPSCH